jgi:hypothetical protein
MYSFVQQDVVARNEIEVPTAGRPGPLSREVVAYPAATMLACTEFSVLSDGYPLVMTPS